MSNSVSVRSTSSLSYDNSLSAFLKKIGKSSNGFAVMLMELLNAFKNPQKFCFLKNLFAPIRLSSTRHKDSNSFRGICRTELSHSRTPPRLETPISAWLDALSDVLIARGLKEDISGSNGPVYRPTKN